MSECVGYGVGVASTRFWRQHRGAQGLHGQRLQSSRRRRRLHGHIHRPVLVETDEVANHRHRVSRLIDLESRSSFALHDLVVNDVIGEKQQVGRTLASGFPHPHEDSAPWQDFGVGTVGVEDGDGGEAVVAASERTVRQSSTADDRVSCHRHHGGGIRGGLLSRCSLPHASEHADQQDGNDRQE